MKFFHLSVRLTNEKPGAFVCPFDKSIKSLYFRSFVVSVLSCAFISRSYENRSIILVKIIVKSPEMLSYVAQIPNFLMLDNILRSYDSFTTPFSHHQGLKNEIPLKLLINFY